MVRQDILVDPTNGNGRLKLATNGNGVRHPEKFAIPTAVSPQTLPDAPDKAALYLNKELAWLDFNWRVLALALDKEMHLLERVRFLAITASNLDEFVQKRIGGLKRQQAAGVSKLSTDGRTPSEQLQALHPNLQTMYNKMVSLWEEELKPELKEQAGIHIYNYEELTQTQKKHLYAYFRREIYPILTPLAVDPGRPFPFISNLSLSMTIVVQVPEEDELRFLRLKVPVTRWIPVPKEDGSEQHVYLPAEQLIAQHMNELCPGMNVLRIHPFRITRNADVRQNEEEADDLLSMISEELRERRFAPVVRLELDKAMPIYERQLLMRELGLGEDDIYEADGLLDLTALFALADLPFPQLQYPAWEPVIPARIQRMFHAENDQHGNIFQTIREGDILVHHPYESFAATTQRLIEEAANDPHVIAIKLTLYRTSRQSAIVRALKRAAENGKQVAALVEVKARFDEANNIEWGQALEESGVHVGYGLVGLKTHTKTTLILRRDMDGLRTYCHIGTGNYNAKTARLYTDLGLLTCDPDLGQDLINLFHALTGYAPAQNFNKVLVAPINMRDRFNVLIDHEIKMQAKYGNGRIIAKMNALDDLRIIKKLYVASQAGVKIDLIIRGHCCLRPGIPDYSDNIRVISILGRFLEHDRIYYFNNNGRPLIFFGSADWRGRNLNSRVELITPISKLMLKNRLISILEDALADNQLAWEMDMDGNFQKIQPRPDDQPINFHESLMTKATAS